MASKIYLFIALGICIYLFLYTLFKDWKLPFKKALKKLSYVTDVERIESSLEEKVFKTDDTTKKKNKIKYITGAKLTLSQRIKAKINDVISNRNHSWGYLTFTIATLVSAFVGFMVGKSVNNLAISITLATVFSALPYFYLSVRIKIVEKDKDKKLLMVMGNIVATYMVKDSFPLSVKEVLPTIPNPLYRHFKLYVDEIMHFGEENFVKASERLANAINNYYFYEFMQLAVQSELGETGLKYTMKSIPVDYQRYLEKNEKYARIISDYNIDFFLRVMLLPLVVGFIKVVSDDYYNILTNNIIGKIILFGILVVYIVSAFIFMRCNKDIKLEV